MNVKVHLKHNSEINEEARSQYDPGIGWQHKVDPYYHLKTKAKGTVAVTEQMDWPDDM